MAARVDEGRRCQRVPLVDRVAGQLPGGHKRAQSEAVGLLQRARRRPVGREHPRLRERPLVAKGAVLRCSGAGVDIATASAALHNSVVVVTTRTPLECYRRWRGCRQVGLSSAIGSRMTTGISRSVFVS